VIAELSFLAIDDESRRLLDAIPTGAITTMPPSPIDPRTPASLRRILEHVGGMWFGEPGTSTGIELRGGFHGALHVLGRDAGLKARRDGFDYDPSICSPIDDGLSCFYLFHPVNGELRLFDQDGGLEAVDLGDPGTVFLRLVAAETR
jgi:hypothetical protein